ncbi:unnamed protein product [Alopecurus aequalis]
MCFVDRPSRPLGTETPSPHHAGCKRPRAEMETALALYDPSAADQQPEDFGALVPFVPSLREGPINAIPLSAVAPNPKKMNLAPRNAVRAEPPWLRSPRGLLRRLKFRIDLPVYFVDEKAVTATDLVPHQNRFRLPSEGVARNLLPLLSALELKAANQAAPRPPKLPKLPRAPGEKATKRKGKKHGGLPVLVVEPHTGVRELQLARWDSSGGTVIKGEGYLQFINSCGFKVDDVVEIWAFKEKYFRLFGEDYCHESPLYLLIAKKGELMAPRSCGEETVQDRDTI